MKTNFWWDIENDIMFWIKDNDFEKKFKTIIEKKPNNVTQVINFRITNKLL